MQKKFVTTVILIISIIVVIKFWSFKFIEFNPTITSLSLFFVYFIFFANQRIHYKFTDVDILVIYTLFTIFISAIPAYYDYHQPILRSFAACIMLSLGLFFYFVLKSVRYTTLSVINNITPIFIIWVFLELFQQTTYPIYWFAGRDEFELTGELENRMGLWRFYIWGVDFVLLLMCYWVKKMINKANVKTSFIAIVLIAGLLCYCSRKHIYITIICILYLVFASQNIKRGLLPRLLLILMLTSIVAYFYSSFKSFNDEASLSQGEGTEFIRYLAANYFINNYSSSALYPFFGTGLVHGDGALMQKINYVHEAFHFYAQDCGIVGYYSRVGLVGISSIVYFFFVLLRNWSYIDTWLKAFVFAKVFLLFVDFWAMWQVGMFAFAIFLFFLDRNIQENKKKKELYELPKKQIKVTRF